jgi:hypothetical protein
MRISYTEQDRESIINEQTAKGLYLVEDAITMQGNYLEFDTQPLIIQDPVDEEKILMAETIIALEARVNELEGAV